MATPNIKANSTAFKIRAILSLLYLSAISPAVADKRKNGKINRPAIILDKISDWETRHIVTIVNKAFLNILSFNAPRNWVISKGKKRCDLNRFLFSSAIFYLHSSRSFWGYSS